MKWRGNFFLGILNNMQMILIKRGSVETGDSPYKDFDKDFNEVLKLLDSHQTDNPRCNVEKSEWNANVQELMTAYESLPRHIVNPSFQPNADSARSPFSPTNVCSEIIRRNLFKSPKVQAREIVAEDVSEESPSEAATESSDNCNSVELTELKERLLKTDAKKSREERGKVVDYIVANKDVLAHNKCLLCGYEFTLFKNLYKHYRNIKCTKPTNIRKKPEKKGSVKPVGGRPTSIPVVVDKTGVQLTQEEEDIVDTSVIEHYDETESILTFICHPLEIDVCDSLPDNQGREREREDIFEEVIDESRSHRSRSPVLSDESNTQVGARTLSTPIKPGLQQSLGVESPVLRIEEYLRNLPDPHLRYTPKQNSWSVKPGWK